MKKDMIVLIVRIFLFIVGIAAVCIGYNETDQTLLYAGVTCNSIAFLLSFVSRRKGGE